VQWLTRRAQQSDGSGAISVQLEKESVTATAKMTADVAAHKAAVRQARSLESCARVSLTAQVVDKLVKFATVV